MICCSLSSIVLSNSEDTEEALKALIDSPADDRIGALAGVKYEYIFIYLYLDG